MVSVTGVFTIAIFLIIFKPFLAQFLSDKVNFSISLGQIFKPNKNGI